MTMSKPLIPTLFAALTFAGCATQGPTHLYLAGDATQPIQQIALEDREYSEYESRLRPSDRVSGLGYEFNTDYVWLRVAPGSRLIAIKRFEEELWYDYRLPDMFNVPAGQSGDLAVRAFDRMVYAALPGGRVGEVTRYGEILGIHRLSSADREIGGLAWDQASDQLLVLWAEGREVSWFSRRDWSLQKSVELDASTDPFSLAYDSNRGRIFVPLAGREELGEFDLGGKLLGRMPLGEGVGAIDAGQFSAVRVF